MNRKVRALMVEKGIKQKEIADELGVQAPAISGALNGHWESQRVRKAIATRLGITMKQLDRIWSTAA
jgi:transcriptional regulator with XRE-family HTH domain